MFFGVTSLAGTRRSWVFGGLPAPLNLTLGAKGFEYVADPRAGSSDCGHEFTGANTGDDPEYSVACPLDRSPGRALFRFGPVMTESRQALEAAVDSLTA